MDAYRAKRDFGATPEPAPGPPPRPGAETRFVVQRHEARRLHYDLRLEVGGVLASFAVPKGFSWDPAAKHLAVRTEDHPLEYLTFEGTIPKGQYGAGTMTVWDSGTYSLAKGGAPEAALAAGKLEVAFRGRRLRGEWHMVKTRGEDQWLLFKYRDRYARGPDEAPFPLDLTRASPSPFPRRPGAMEATPAAEAFYDPEWVFELRLSGRRLFLGHDAAAVRALLPGGRALGIEVPGLVSDLGWVRAERFLMDGVLVAHDPAGRPNAELLAELMADGETGELVYYAFDLLHYEDWSLRGFTLLERKRALASLLPRRSLRQLLYVDHVAGRGDELFRSVRAAGLGGIVAKAKHSRYRRGPSEDWLTVPVPPAAGPPSGHVLDALTKAESGSGIRTRVRLTNMDKVYWPASGRTKGDLVAYYDRIADVLLPYLKDRPAHLLRYPDGITGKAFYQKRVTDHLPDWVPTAEVGGIGGEAVRHVICNDRDTLLYLANLGSIDVHPWMSRVGSLDSPDYLVFDLDPSEHDFAAAVPIARAVGRLLRGAGMRPVLKTSGASGLHVFVPLVGGYTYDQARMFAELVARLIVREHPDVATIERSVAKRRGKVYIDYLQNARGQTVVPPYIVRPQPGATVSAPLDWDELEGELGPEDFDIGTVPDRVARVGDQFSGVLHDPQDIMVAVSRLQGG